MTRKEQKKRMNCESFMFVNKTSFWFSIILDKPTTKSIGIDVKLYSMDLYLLYLYLEEQPGGGAQLCISLLGCVSM